MRKALGGMAGTLGMPTFLLQLLPYSLKLLGL